MTSPVSLGGVLPVLSVPFTDEERLDEAALAGEIEWLIAGGVDGVVTGMVSEILRMTQSQRRELTEAVVRIVDGRVWTVIAVGAESTTSAAELAAHAESVGATAVMVNPPLTASLDDEALFAYFSGVTDAAGSLPVVIQDASGYIGTPLSIDLMLRLLSAYGPEKVLFKPEAVPLGPRVTQLYEASNQTARIFEGSGGLALVESRARGAVGTMPGPDLAWAIVAIWRALAESNADRADELSAGVCSILAHVSSLDSYVAVEKHLLVTQGVLPSARRILPSGFDLDAVTTSEIERLMARLRRLVDAEPSA